MYSFEDRMRAVRLYIQYDCGAPATVRELGCPKAKVLRSWHTEYVASDVNRYRKLAFVGA